MAMVDVFFGRSRQFEEALAQLKRTENEIFDLAPGEVQESPIHARMDVRRFKLLYNRTDLYHAENRMKQDRNWYTTLIIGVVLLAKGIIEFPNLHEIWHFIATL